MHTSSRPELGQPVAALHATLLGKPERFPLSDLAALFGGGPELVERVATRGDITLDGDVFFNSGPEMSIPAGRVELEIPSLMRGTWRVDDAMFAMTFSIADFTLRACAQVAVFRKCFELKEIRGTASDIVLDFGGSIADRRYTF